MEPWIISMVIAGALVGLVSSYFGVGACFIMVPVMIYCFETFFATPPSLAPLIAFGTNMAVVVPTALSGLLRHKRELASRGVRFPLAHYASFALPAGLGSVLGALSAYTLFVAFRAAMGLAMKTAFGIACLVGAYRFVKARPIPVHEIPELSIAKFACAGLASGFAAHIIGIGGGLIYVPVLNALLLVPIHIAIPLSLATMVIGSSVGSICFSLLGSLDQALHPEDYPPLSFGWFNAFAFLTIGIASIVTAQIGPIIAHKTPPRRLKLLLALLYTYIGIRLVVRGICQLMGIPPIIP